MTTTTRQRGVSVRPLDLTGRIEALAVDPVWTDAFPDDNPRVGFGPYALGTDRHGSRYVICEEGVGWPVDEQTPFRLDLYTEGKDRRTFGVFPVGTLTLTLDELEALAGEPVDLADHVRRFGSRLEQNFQTWYETLGTGE